MIYNLFKVTVPQITIKSHQALLRDFLLADVRFASVQKSSVWQEIWQLIMGKRFKKLAAAVVFASALLLVFLIISANGKSSPVEAQELMDRMVVSVSKLNPDQQVKVEAAIKSDLSSLIEEAKLAKDLVVVTQNEIYSVNATQSSLINDNGGKLSVADGIVLLTYTNPQGEKIVLGVEEKTDIPVFKLLVGKQIETDLDEVEDREEEIVDSGQDNSKQDGQEENEDEDEDEDKDKDENENEDEDEDDRDEEERQD